MNVDENIHQGHRKRMLDKALKYSDMLSDHELLEVVLFYAIPRIDTNKLAHTLLRAFGSVEKIFSSSPNSLMAIDGVGEKTAILIHTIGKLFSRAKTQNKPSLKTLGKFKEFVLKEVKNYDSEQSIIIMLDPKFNVIGKLAYTDYRKFYVSMDINEVVNCFGALRPTHAVLVHTHLSDNCLPSKQDDIATKKLNILCTLHGVNLVDHVITNGKKIFSYRDDGALDMIKNETDIDNVLNLGGLK